MRARNKREDRSRRDAERRAESRRSRMQSAGAVVGQQKHLEEAPVSPRKVSKRKITNPSTEPKRAPVDNKGSLRFILKTLILSFFASLAALSGLPIVGHGWSVGGLIPLAIAVGVAFSLRRNREYISYPVKVTAVLSALVITSVTLLGVHNQVYIEDQPVLRNSNAEKSVRLADRIVADLIVIEQNQKLLNLPAEQARGLGDLYKAAVDQDLKIAARWNPAVATDVPLPGFVDVFRLVNQVSDLQARALGEVQDDLLQPDPARQQRISEMRSTIIELLTGPEGAAVTLARTVAPLGIELSVGTGDGS